MSRFNRSSVKTVSQPRSAALLALVCMTPGYCSPNGDAGEAPAKNSLAFALFVQGRMEDAIALAVESIQIDLSIGGRFQIANTLTNIGHAYAKLGDLPRAQAYLKRARETHELYGDKDNRVDTLIVSAEAALEGG